MMGQVNRTAVFEQRETKPYRLDAEAQERVVSHTPMAYAIASRFARAYGLDVKEAISFALMELCRAAARYDPASNASFLTYGYTCVERAMRTYLKRERSARRVFSFSDLHDEEDCPFDPVDQSLSVADRCPWDMELLAKIEKHLPPRLWYVLRCQFADGQSLRTVGESLGVSKECVRQLVKRAIRKARRIAEGTDAKPHRLRKAGLARKRERNRGIAVESTSAKPAEPAKPKPSTTTEDYTTEVCPQYLIVALLATRGRPQTAEEMSAVLCDQQPCNVEATIRELLEGQRIVEEEGRYRLA